MKVSRSIALIAFAGALLISCGGATSGGSEGDGAASTAGSDRDAVIEQFGRAMVSGDITALVSMLEPSVQASLTAEDRSSFEAVERSGGQAELKDFSYSIVREDQTSANVEYAGERCAPTVSQVFGPTSLAGDETSPDQSSTDGGAVIETGEVVCSDIGAVLAAPVEFVNIDGRWYGRVPGR